MNQSIRKIKIAAMILFVCAFCASTLVFAYDNSDINVINDKVISDTHKIWTVKFNTSIDINSFSNSVQIKDLTDGTIQQVSVVVGDKDNSIKVNPPSQGYKTGHNYQISVDKNIKSISNKNLKRAGLMNFKVMDVNTGNYTADIKVVVSPFLPILKQITLNSVNLDDVKKIRVEGSDKVLNVGESAVSVINGNSTTIYFYGGDGTTVIAKGTLDVTRSMDNVTIKLANEK